MNRFLRWPAIFCFFPVIVKLPALSRFTMASPDASLIILCEDFKHHLPFFNLPCGKLTQLWEITIFNGKTHYFDWAMFNSYVSHYQRVNPPWFSPVLLHK